MKVTDLIKATGCEFFTGVPDSQLKALCDRLCRDYKGDSRHHIICANEGNCVAAAAGYHLATGKTALVYMQNSGEGNAINPIASLTREEVYGIPMVFVIGWRGEPGVHDEPQHVYQGQITGSLLDELGIKHAVISKDTQVSELESCMSDWSEHLANGGSVAFIVRKGALTDDEKTKYSNDAEMTREQILSHIITHTGDDPIVSTTGKASRELFELREAAGQDHSRDFLTVGSMGHASSIALGIALQKPESTVWCIDGDGAALMHMGALAVNAASGADNLIHIVINNGAHETVGGMPTAARSFSFASTARECGYAYTARVSTAAELESALEHIREIRGLRLIEIDCKIGARDDLGRPTTTPKENKEAFMRHLSTL